MRYNSFFRYKSVLGGGLKARHGKAQRREVATGCHILNRMAELGPAKVGRQPKPSDAWAWGDPGREAFTGSP